MEIITTFFSDPNIEIYLKLFTALCLGMSLGIERAIIGKTAGMRTYGLVTMGSALFVIIGVIAGGGGVLGSDANIQSLHFAGQIITGIGFLGAGLIFIKGDSISGVTTAASIWVSAGIGMAIGYGLYTLAVVATLFAIFVFTVLWHLENRVKALAHLEATTKEE
ncbi:MAG: MgtC/SapB family protein [Candidatus Pacebacteria bacterium]|nr:MgtC/SapB family protein [Candidatus Paceibacterota bacterium]